jgi:hypothetical protein
MDHRPNLDPSRYQAGDHIKARRSGYWHHGIVVGPNKVVELTLPGPLWTKSHGSVRCVELARFAQGRPVARVDYGRNRLTRHETVRRALSCIGARGYNLVTGNCEHLAVELVTGRPFSHQVANAAATSGATGGAVVAAKVSVAAVGAAGPVLGYGAAGITSGLAGVGLGSMAFGVTTVALLPATAAVAATHKLLRDDPHAPVAERHARRAGRQASVAGAVGGAVATRAVVHAVGTAAGAARWTSGLRAVGSLVGGGMRAGTVAAALGPAAAAVGVGWLVYRLVRRKRRR